MSQVSQNKEEKYYFYRLWSIDLDTAKHILGVLKRYRRKDVRYCILRDLIVAYCRPFSCNKGNIGKYQLTKKIVPPELQSLHEELFGLRNQIFAHTDLTYRKPKVVNWSTELYKWFPMAFRGFDYGKLDKKVSEIAKLVFAVERNLQALIDKIEAIEE